jgi:hypothetical protein
MIVFFAGSNASIATGLFFGLDPDEPFHIVTGIDIPGHEYGCSVSFLFLLAFIAIILVTVRLFHA